MKATIIFHCIFFIKSLTFIAFHSIAMHYWHFMILYRNKQNFFVCCCTVSPLGDIGKYFAIIKQKVICQISQILTSSYAHSNIASTFFGGQEKFLKISTKIVNNFRVAGNRLFIPGEFQIGKVEALSDDIRAYFKNSCKDKKVT